MTKELSMPPKSELLLYQTEDHQARVQVRIVNETVWLSLNQIAELFQRDKSVISRHISNIFAEKELIQDATVAKFATVQNEGGREIKRDIEHFNLDVIIAVGYRVKSQRGTQFRIWATERLKEFLVKGFILDDERLKEGKTIGSDYFDELLERIRDIRSSEKRFYQKIRDIYKLAVDYDPDAEETLEFFKIVQNKLHFAISGRTAAELISDRADASKPNMGLTSWKGTKVRRADVIIAKNYLDAEELDQLNRIVEMYLNYAEDQARRRQQIFMREWRQKLDAFLKFNERDILHSAGKVSKEVAEKLALEQYDAFNQNRLALESEAEALADDKELLCIAEAAKQASNKQSVEKASKMRKSRNK